MGVQDPNYAYSQQNHSCGSGQTLQNGTCVSTTSTGSCPSGYIPSATGGCINPNPCGAGEVLANTDGGKVAECLVGTQCPPGETNVDNTCQGTGGGSGQYPQWTFACVNGTKVEYVHNTYTGAILNTLDIGTCSASGSGSSGSGGASPTPPSSSPPAPSCTPSASTSCSGPYLTGCTGSCTSTGCTGTGVATGYEYCTVYHSCPSYTSSYTQPVTTPVTTGTSACQQTVEHQCAWGQPGYAQKEYCLTSPLGGVTNCSGWSTPYYDPKDCPVPTPVGL